jgi:hypothetical protein
MPMICEDVELALLDEPVPEDAQRHLATCPACQAYARDLGLVLQSATPAPLSQADQLALSTLPERALAQWDRRQHPRRPWVGYAVAAGLGALVASAGFWSARPVREVVVERTVEPAAVAVAELEEPNLSADEGFFEVTWPELPEGEPQ